MKNIFLAAAMLLCCTTLIASQGAAAVEPELKLNHTEHNFGKINNKGGEVKHIFTLTNTGNAPLVITSIETSCKCTSATFSKKPIAAGQSSQITITYNPKRQNGTFYKTIQIFSNDPHGRSIVIVQGEVLVAK